MLIWQLIIMIISGILCTFLYKKVIKKTLPKIILVYSFIVSTIIIVIVFGFVFIGLTNYFEHPSDVDVSPLAELGSEHLEYVEEAVTILREKYFRSGSIRISAELFIRISTRPDEDAAISSMELGMELESNRGPRGRGYIHIINDNSTEAILFYELTYMPYLIPYQRRIRSDIRIGHVIFSLHESHPWNQTRRDSSPSSDFVEYLVDILSELTEGASSLQVQFVQGHVYFVKNESLKGEES